MVIKKIRVSIPKYKLKFCNNFDKVEPTKVENTSESCLESEFYEAAAHLVYLILQKNK